MTKGLEALNKLPNKSYEYYLGSVVERDLTKYKSIIEKELKALEVIKKMFDNKLCKLTTFSNDKYGILIRLGGCEDYLYITQEKFTLLKEALGNA